MMKTLRYKKLSTAPQAEGFTLVELLVVVAIMAIVMGILAVSLSQGQGRGIQTAAAQVASGMGVARQTAITRNTDAMFIVAPAAGAGPTDFYPAEPFRYWAVVYSNRGQDTWSLAVDWTELSPGAVFMGLVAQGYNTINWSTNGTIPATFLPQINSSGSGEWQFFNNYTNFTAFWEGGSAALSGVPFIGFRPSGEGFALKIGSGAAPSHAAVILAEGAVVDGGRLALRSTNNITHVETDVRAGRIVVRPRDSYR